MPRAFAYSRSKKHFLHVVEQKDAGCNRNDVRSAVVLESGSEPLSGRLQLQSQLRATPTSKPLPLLAAQILPPQTTHALALAPLLDIPRRHLPVVPHPVQLARVEPGRKILQDDRIVHNHFVVPRRVRRVRRSGGADYRLRDVAEEGYLLAGRTGH